MVRPSGDRVPSGYRPTLFPSSSVRVAMSIAQAVESLSPRRRGIWPMSRKKMPPLFS